LCHGLNILARKLPTIRVQNISTTGSAGCGPTVS
jgi:hypothetical protein